MNISQHTFRTTSKQCYPQNALFQTLKALVNGMSKEEAQAWRFLQFLLYRPGVEGDHLGFPSLNMFDVRPVGW